MGVNTNSRQKEKESDDEVYVDDGFISSFFVRATGKLGVDIGGNGSQEETRLEDQDELENGDT